ncbi:hypothetical protein GF337_05650 [candidate division KSB1 bacterium]|nr:hypothetical protein [candidate division KSB1 bacterium]
MLKNISTLDAVFVTLMAACGLAIKPVVGPLSKLISTMLLLPGGSFAGAVYMLFPMLALLVVREKGTASLVGLIQGVIVTVSGIYGSHGILSIITYLFPCLAIDASYILLQRFDNWLQYFIPPAMGNTVGALLVAILFLHLPLIPLLIGLIPAFIFGGIGGLLAKKLYGLLVQSFPQFGKEG